MSQKKLLHLKIGLFTGAALSKQPELVRRWLPALAALLALATVFAGLHQWRNRQASASSDDMVWIAPGSFDMGSDEPMFVDAQPVHQVQMHGFWIDCTEVTNAAFERFVDATGYVTVAERKPRAEDYPGAPAEALVAGSVVFSPPSGKVSLTDAYRWWRYLPGADWRHPEGPGSDIAGREQHPVVHVAYEDVLVYARWAGKRLPTEAEWEYAARGGLARQPFTWGAEMHPGGRTMANTFQGRFPGGNTGEDGYIATAPVTAFPPNGFGLYGVSGNVWEWTADWYRPDTYTTQLAAGATLRDPQGPSDSYDPDEPGSAKRVLKGGSFLCTDDYCGRYRPGGRSKGAVDTGSNHTGFRLVRDAGEAAR